MSLLTLLELATDESIASGALERALSSYGPDSEELLQALCRRAESTYFVLNRKMLAHLKRHRDRSSVVTALTRRMLCPRVDAGERKTLRRILPRPGKSAVFREELVAALERSSNCDRKVAVEILREDVLSKPVWSALLEILNCKRLGDLKLCISLLSDAVKIPTVRRHLARKLKEDAYNFPQTALIVALSTAVSHRDVREALIKHLQSRSKTDASFAAQVLAPAVNYPEVRDAFIDCLACESTSVAETVKRALSGCVHTDVVWRRILVMTNEMCFEDARPLWSAMVEWAKLPKVRTKLIQLTRKAARPESRAGALKLLAEAGVKNRSVKRAFISALRDEHRLVQHGAMTGFKRLELWKDDPSAISAALKLLAHEGSWIVEETMCGFSCPHEVEAVVLERYPKAATTAERLSLLKILSFESRVPRIRDFFISAVDDSDEEIRLYVVGILVNVTFSRQVEEALCRALKDPSADVRRAAIKALSYRPAVKAKVRKALLEATKDEEPRVRCAALSALGKQSDDGKIDRLVIDFLRDDDAKVRNTAALAINERGITAKTLWEHLSA